MSGSTRSSVPTSVTAYPDGPLIVRGPIEVRDESGEIVEHARRTVALCRCGASAIKPWCDGTHKLTGFTTHAPEQTASDSGA